MPNLTPEQVAKYISLSGQRCPFCDSPNIQAGEMGVPNYDMAFQDVQCLDCNKTWTDEYKLVGVTVSEDEPSNAPRKEDTNASTLLSQ